MGYLLFIPTVFYLLFGCPMANFWLLLRKQSHLADVNSAFGLSIAPKVTQRNWVSAPNWVPSGLWSKWHNPLSKSPQIAEKTLPRLVPRFSKLWKYPQYPKQLYLNAGGLETCIIPHRMQSLVFKTLAFAYQSNQWVKIQQFPWIGANAPNTPNNV